MRINSGKDVTVNVICQNLERQKCVYLLIQEIIDQNNEDDEELMEDPSFFKVLINDFTSKLLLPPAFSRKFEGILREGNVKLRLNSGQTWEVKLEITEGQKYKFTRGWSGFAEDVGLKVGEFLVFRVTGKSVFDVALYGVTCCQRGIPADNFQDEDSGDDEVEYKIHNSPGVMNNMQYPKVRNVDASKRNRSSELPERPLYFEIVLKKHQSSRLTLPKKFLIAAGLMGQATVCLEYLPENRCEAVVMHYRGDSRRFDLTAGWSKFRKSNGLVFGKSYSFEFRPRKNVIQVEELKTKSE